MKRKRMPQPSLAPSSPSGKLSPKEKKALKTAIQAMNRQAEALGTLDPLEFEPVLVYSLKEGRK